MKSYSYVVLFAVCWLYAVPARAELWLKPQLGKQWGTTDFELQLEAESAGRDVKVRSLLEWPVDMFLAGLQVGASLPRAEGNNAWLFEGRIDASLGDPRGKMEDSDWLSSRSEGIAPTLFAHTRSKTEGFAILSELSAGYRFGHLQRHELVVDVLAGNRVEYYALTAFGAQGEYLDESGNFAPVDISSDLEAAVYKVWHILPFAGSRVVWTPLARLSFPLMARVHALLSYSHDDHVLRNKDAYGRAYGAAFSASAGVDFAIAPPVSIGVTGEFYYLKSLTGVLEQEFYADDPGTEADERKGSVPDSDFAVASLRGQVMAFARVAF